MRKIRMKRREPRAKAIMRDLGKMVSERMPPGGRVVVTMWVSPDAVSEEERARLHAYLIQSHRATGVLSIGLKGAEAGPEAV